MVGANADGFKHYTGHIHNKQYNTEMMHLEILMNNFNKSRIFAGIQAEIQ